MTYEALVAQARELPGVEEWASKRDIGLSRDGGWMLTLKKGEIVAAKVGWDAHDRLLAEFPEIFFKTPHYEGYPAVLARVADLTPATAGELLTAAWEDAPNKATMQGRRS